MKTKKKTPKKIGIGEENRPGHQRNSNEAPKKIENRLFICNEPKLAAEKRWFSSARISLEWIFNGYIGNIGTLDTFLFIGLDTEIALHRFTCTIHGWFHALSFKFVDPVASLLGLLLVLLDVSLVSTEPWNCFMYASVFNIIRVRLVPVFWKV